MNDGVECMSLPLMGQFTTCGQAHLHCVHMHACTHTRTEAYIRIQEMLQILTVFLCSSALAEASVALHVQPTTQV